MSYTATEIQTFLSQKTPFRVLTPSVLTEVVSQMRPLRYRMGQTLLLKDKLPHQIIILYEGQVRLLGYDPTTKMPATLELLGTGAMIGWMGLLRGIACETAIASTETIGLTLAAEQFFELLQQYPRLAQEFHQQTNLSEVFDLLSHQSLPNVEGPKALCKMVSSVLAEVQVCSLEPGRHVVAELPLGQTPNTTWFVSGGSEVKGQRPNQPLKVPPSQLSLEIVGEQPARLIGVAELELLAPPAPPPPAKPARGGALERVAQPAAATAATTTVDVPYAPEVRTVEAPTPPQLSSSEPKARRGAYPLVRAATGVDAAIACFQMVSQYFQMPFRREVISRVLNDQMNRQGEISLYNCGAIAELMGLNAQLVNLPARSLPQIQTPALVRWQESLAILYEVSDRQIVIGSPELGVLRRNLSDFTDTWDKVGQVLLLQPSKHTPQERFGLSWFWPVLAKHKRVLVEVFVASFFVQVFALANPLIVQVIIDKVIVQNSKDTLQILGVFLLGVAVFEFLLSTVRTYLFVDTTNRIDMSLGSEIIDHLLRLPLGYFDRRPVGELSSRINELENIRNFLTGTALNVVLDALFSVVYIAVMFIYSWKLALLSLVTVPLFMGLTFFFSP
ncbi:MAG: ABC transporter transmembrane domain-containing protein, partial [Spirulinaceae cyanobacterium]